MDKIPHLIFLMLSHVPCFKRKMHPVERNTASPGDPVNNAAATPTSNTLDKSRRALLKPTGVVVVAIVVIVTEESGGTATAA
jgi:hypothetical protein